MFSKRYACSIGLQQMKQTRKLVVIKATCALAVMFVLPTTKYTVKSRLLRHYVQYA